MSLLIKTLQNPLLNISELERRVGCPERTIKLGIAEYSPKSIPEKWYWNICRELALAGIKIGNYELDFDTDDMIFIVSIKLDKEAEVVEHEEGENKSSWFEYKVSYNRWVIGEPYELIEFIKKLQ